MNRRKFCQLAAASLAAFLVPLPKWLPVPGKQFIGKFLLDREGDNPAAISVPFGTLPQNFYFRYPRYVVTFERFVPPRFIADIVYPDWPGADS